MTRRPPATSTSGTSAATNGTRISAPDLAPSPATTEQVLAVVQHVGDLADPLPAGGQHLEPDELMIAEVLRVTRLVELRGVHQQHDPAQLLGPVPVADAGERHQQPPRVPARRADRERPVGGWLGRQDRASREPQVRVVRPHLDDEIAADTVRPADPADDQLHGS